jgi:hypothetical protein
MHNEQLFYAFAVFPAESMVCRQHPRHTWFVFRLSCKKDKSVLICDEFVNRVEDEGEQSIVLDCPRGREGCSTYTDELVSIVVEAWLRGIAGGRYLLGK